jgi:undecaprenyl-diphosphatase
MAHGDLARHSVVVDEAGAPWLVDFDHAAAVASERLRQADLVELAVSLAVRLGAERALAGAVATVGPVPLAAALAATAPRALTATTREELGDRPGLREDLARLTDPEVRRRSSDPSR